MKEFNSNIEQDGQGKIDFSNQEPILPEDIEASNYEKEKQDFIKKIGVYTDYDISGVEKDQSGNWTIHGMTINEWKKYLKDN